MQKKVNAQVILQKAFADGYAVGAFNAANLLTVKAIVNAAVKLRSPVIIEASAGEIAWLGLRQMRVLVSAYRSEIGLPILLNLDHALDLNLVRQAIRLGYDLIHLDASTLSLAENIQTTRQAAQWAHQQGLLCEGELDHIQGSSDNHRDQAVKQVLQTDLYTRPSAAADFVNKTGVDILAVFFGNVHGVYREPPELNFTLLREIRRRVKVMLSMHGGSGIDPASVRRAIQLGRIVKINVNTELRIAYREALEAVLARTDSVKPYQYYQPVLKAVQAVVEKKMHLFGSVGKA